MQTELFPELPDESSIWIFGYKEELDAESRQAIEAQLAGFLPDWASHGRKVEAGFTIYAERLVIVAAHCRGGISGCSKDSLFRQFQILAEKGIDLLARDLVFYRDPSGALRAVRHLDFFGLVEEGRVTEDTPVLDTLITTLGQLRRDRLEKSFDRSWHAQTYSTVRAS